MFPRIYSIPCAPCRRYWTRCWKAARRSRPAPPGAAMKDGRSSKLCVTCATPKSGRWNACVSCAITITPLFLPTIRIPGPGNATTPPPTCAQHIAELAQLSPQQWEQRGQHEEQGEITISSQALHIAAHDAIHAAQIARQLKSVAV